MSLISTGVELRDFTTGLNGGATIDLDLLNVLVENGKAIIEEERPWMVLQKTDKSKTIGTGQTWETAIDLSTITDLSRLYVTDDQPAVQVFDGVDSAQNYYLKPFDQRLDWKNHSDTCVYDENANKLYLNGVPPITGTLWVNYIGFTDDINLASSSAIWTQFPKRFLPLLAYYAVGIFKGGVDYDTINKLMLPTNQATLTLIKEAMIDWDNAKVLASIQANDPSDFSGGGRGHRQIDRYGGDNYGGY